MSNRDWEYYNVQLQAGSIQVQTSDQNKRNQPHLIDQIVLVNAADLNETNFACYFPAGSLAPQPMDISFSTEKKALSLAPRSGPFKLGDIDYVYYGSSNKHELNVCNKHSFDYNIIDGQLPDLSKV